MKSKKYTIRTMSREDLDIAIEWAAAEGWNPGLHDADCFYSADRNGFFIAYLGDEPVAVISAVRYGESFGFLGFYIVKPEYRGNGYGIRIWDAGLEYLKDRNVGLDGVVARQNDYKKSGFRLAFRNIRYQSRGGEKPGSPLDWKIVPLSALSFETIAAYDRAFFPEDRSQFLNAWVNQPQAVSLGVIQDGKLAGYGVMRRCRTGYKVGPLFADSSQQAESLFASMKSRVSPTEFVYLDVPEVNENALALAERHHMNAVFETARMYMHGNPDISSDRLFGITSFELG